MRRIIIALILAAAPAPAMAQQATEIYIPIGRSPGLSGTKTVIGRIDAIDAQTMTLTVRGADGRAWAMLEETSKIYLDRSTLARPCRYGFAEDCQIGRLCEVKWRRNNPGGRAEPGEVEWIKIRPHDDHSRGESPIGFVPALAMGTPFLLGVGVGLPFGG